MIAGRTCDNPGFFRQAIKAGATHILLEKPGAPTVGELEAMAREAKAAKVPVYMGFIKNISGYVEGALAAANGAAGAEAAETKLGEPQRLHEATLQECFERNAEGMLKNMAIHEIALACQFPGASRRHHYRRDPQPQGRQGFSRLRHADVRRQETDFASVDVTLVNRSSARCRISADRCSGDLLLRDRHGHVERRRFIPAGDGRRRAGQEGRRRGRRAHPDWFSYLYTQAGEYAKLKRVCAAHALAGTTPPGVATIDRATARR